jgi:ABC-type glutathione transport system ATPase component
MRFDSFQVTNYRNVIDSGPINVTNITGIVGQNEAGKSNLFEALYRVNPYDGNADYNIDEDWPVDKWGERSGNETALVCVANFAITCAEEISDLYDAAFPESTTETTD